MFPFAYWHSPLQVNKILNISEDKLYIFDFASAFSLLFIVFFVLFSFS